jgi:hypothetical protein
VAILAAFAEAEAFLDAALRARKDLVEQRRDALQEEHDAKEERNHPARVLEAQEDGNDG